MEGEYERALGKLRKLKRNRKISACYVFGSYLKDSKRARDIDICIISKGLSSDEMAKIMLDFDKPIDVSFMEKMPYYIAVNVFRNGKPVFVRNRGELAKKWMEVVGQQLAYGGMRERIYRGVAKWMTSKTPSTA